MHQYIILEYFIKQAKQILKKHKKLELDIIQTLKTFSPNQANQLGYNVYKLRILTKSLNKGKNASFRLIILFIKQHNLIVPITIYYKGDIPNMSVHEIKHHTEMAWQELNTRHET